MSFFKRHEIVYVFVGSMFIVFLGTLLYIGQLTLESDAEISRKLDFTYNMEYEMDYRNIEISEMKLYPNMIEQDERAKLSIIFHNGDNVTRTAYFDVISQNGGEPDFWLIEMDKPTPITIKRFGSEKVSVNILSVDTAGMYSTEIFEVRLFDEDYNLIDQQNIPLRSTANLEWID